MSSFDKVGGVGTLRSVWNRLKGDKRTRGIKRGYGGHVETAGVKKRYKKCLNVSGLCNRVGLLLNEDSSENDAENDAESMPRLSSSSSSSTEGSDSGMSESIGQVTSLCRDRRPTPVIETGVVTVTQRDLPLSLGFSDASVNSDGWEEVYDLEGNPTGVEVLEIGIRRLGLGMNDEDEMDAALDDRVMLELGDRNDVERVGMYIDDVGGVVVQGWRRKFDVLVTYALWVILASIICTNMRVCSGLNTSGTGCGQEADAVNCKFSGRENGVFNSPSISDRENGVFNMGSINAVTNCPCKSGRENCAFNSPSISDRENGVLNMDSIKAVTNCPCKSGRENCAFNIDRFNTVICVDEKGVSNKTTVGLCDRQVQANNNTVKGRGQSGAERGGGTPPAELSDPSCLENDLDEEFIECARDEEVKCEALATCQAQIDDFSSASFWKI